MSGSANRRRPSRPRSGPGGHVRQKLGAFIEKHGFTFKAYLIALAIFPPAAVYIPFKIPGIMMGLRIGMVALTLGLHALILTGGFAVLTALAARAFKLVAQ